MIYLRNLVLAVVCCLIFNCGSDDGDTNEDICGTYPAWESSDYVLPFPVGNTFRISQANCTNASHQGTLRFSYDIEMPFGSPVTAARDGVILAVRDSQPAGARGLTASNWVQIRHNNGLVSEYVHLAQNSARFSAGQQVVAGDTIAFTGDTGDVGSFPHLHFDINPCANNLACDTRPVTFRNTTANPDGLIFNTHYEALPF
ncbi:MAG: M23 family metallopeptidase [Roseivirga sp.]|nr:M23 family metallopeptidase [Roseivirga sp.]